jgi:hypothetical protein
MEQATAGRKAARTARFGDPSRIRIAGPYQKSGQISFLACGPEHEILAEAKLGAERIHDQASEQAGVQGREEAGRTCFPVTAFANAGQALIVFEEQMVSRYTPQPVRGWP